MLIQYPLFKIIQCLSFSGLIITSLSGQKNSTPKNSLYEINFIQNPGAEQEGGNEEVPQWQPLPPEANWYYLHDYYGHTGGEWEFDCDESCGLPKNAGTYYFRLPQDEKIHLRGLSQTLDLYLIADTLVVRKLEFLLTGYMTGIKCDQPGCTRGVLEIAFFDNLGKLLKKYEASRDNFEMKLANPDDGRMRLFEKISLSQEIPLLTAKAIITMKSESNDCCNGSFNFFDNLSFSLLPGELRQ